SVPAPSLHRQSRCAHPTGSPAFLAARAARTLAGSSRAAPFHLFRCLAGRSEEHPDRRAAEAKILPELILQKTLVGEMHQFRIVDKKDEGWRINRQLRDVAQLEQLATPAGWLMVLQCLLNHLIELARRHAQRTYLPDRKC